MTPMNITLPGSGLKALLIPGAVGGDALATGEWAAAILKDGIETHLGKKDFPLGEVFLHYVRITNVPEFKFMGQGEAVWGTWEWKQSTGQYSNLGLAVGVEAFIYDAQGQPHVLGPGSGTSQGFRYMGPDGTLHYTDETYVSVNGLNQREDLGNGLVLGQGTAEGGLRLWDGKVLRTLDATLSVLFHNVHFVGQQIALAYTRPDGVVIVHTDVATLQALPIYTPPQPQAPKPVPPPPAPKPTPVPTPTPPMPEAPVPFDWSTAVIAGNSVDVRTWPETASITHLQFDHDGVSVSFTKQNEWPDVHPPHIAPTDALQFTLWIAEQISGKWNLLPVLEFWRGGKNGGDVTQAVGFLDQIQANWCYWAGPLSEHPVPAGQQIGFFVTSGDQRQMNVATIQERSNIVFVQRPATVPAGFDFTSQPSVPSTPSNPPPSNPPSEPSHPVDFGPLMAQIQALQDQVAALSAQLPSLNVSVDVAAIKTQLQKGFTGHVDIFGQKTTLDITPK